MKFIIALSSILFCSMAFAVEKDPLTVTLFYESYCPGCQEYMRDQMVGVWNSFKGHILYDLLPYGDADQEFVDGKWKFTCPHGPIECQANKLHACAINKACNGSETVKCDVDKVSQVLTYITCVEKHEDQMGANTQCSKKANLDASAIMKCAKGKEGNTLLNFYGNRTAAYKPGLGYVPTVAINWVHDEEAEDDLRNEICRLRPALC